MTTKWISISVLFIFLLFMIDLIRREKLTFKYASGWMALASSGIFFAVFDRYLFALACWMGFELPSNFIFFSLMVFMVFLSLLLTAFLCQQEKRNEILAQKIALLQNEIEQFKKDTQNENDTTQA